MSDYNQVILIGHLCFKPDLSYTPTGTAYAKTRIATNFTALKKDGKKYDDTMFIDCVAWAKLAETIASHLDKGSRVMIQGRIKYDKWTTKDGQARSKHAVQVSKVIFLGKSDIQKIDEIDEHYTPTEAQTDALPKPGDNHKDDDQPPEDDIPAAVENFF
jgi:single-strand DNA-binding protein